MRVHPRRGRTDLSSNQSLEAGLEVVDATVVELGHLLQQLLVLGLKVFLDRPELFSGLRCGEERGHLFKSRRSLYPEFYMLKKQNPAAVDVLAQKHIHPPQVSEETTKPSFVCFIAVKVFDKFHRRSEDHK